MIDIYNKISTHGLILEGCFTIQKGLNYYHEGMYSGNKLQNDAESLFRSTDGDVDNISAYLLIDNHTNIHLLDKTELEKFVPTGLNVQYVRGVTLCKNGVPTVSLEQMKYVNWNGKVIPGSKVVLNYRTKQIIIDTESVPFEEIDRSITMVNQGFFSLSGKTVIARDQEQNIIIIYHPNIDLFNLQLLLHTLNVTDAILLCESNNGPFVGKEMPNHQESKVRW